MTTFYLMFKAQFYSETCKESFYVFNTFLYNNKPPVLQIELTCFLCI